jgi:hypothetical protein
VFDHLSLTRPVAERDLEQALMDRLQATLLEFGHGMAFVGRQVRFDPDGDEQVVDLLLFHVEQLRYIVVELKVNRLTGGDVGQLGTYVARRMTGCAGPGRTRRPWARPPVSFGPLTSSSSRRWGCLISTRSRSPRSGRPKTLW